MIIRNEIGPNLVAKVSGILQVISTFHTLHDLVRWTATLSPPLLISEVITQDEYTLDVLVPLDGLVLVFDTT